MPVRCAGAVPDGSTQVQTHEWVAQSSLQPGSAPPAPPPAARAAIRRRRVRAADGESREHGSLAATDGVNIQFKVHFLTSPSEPRTQWYHCTVLYCTVLYTVCTISMWSDDPSFCAHPKLFCSVISFTQLICDLYASSENVFVDFPRKFCEMFDDNQTTSACSEHVPWSAPCMLLYYIMYPQHWF